MADYDQGQWPQQPSPGPHDPAGVPPLYPAQHAGYQPPIGKFCPSCGRPAVASAVVCTTCGTSLGMARSKTVAVLLAVFLWFWTWLYTYQADAKKFWWGLGLAVVGTVLSFFLVGLLVLLGVWVWAIVDTVNKPESWYQMYAKG